MLNDHNEENPGLTQIILRNLRSEDLTLQDAVKQLQENAQVRIVRETLAKLSNIPMEDKKALQNHLVEILVHNSLPEVKPDSIERKVRMWLKDDTQTISKTSAIQLCFAFNLSIQKSHLLLTKICGETFHWRNPQDIIYIYALLQGMNYFEANDLFERMSEKGLLEKHKGERSIYTGQVKGQIEELTNEKELEDFLKQSQEKLGVLHNTAYEFFMGFLDLLRLPELNDNMPDVKALTICEIMNVYLHQNFIPRLQRATKKDHDSEQLVLSAVQKNIRQNWPDGTILSRMVHRETDVTRKVLILLFLATDGGDSIYDYMGELISGDIYQDNSPYSDDEETERNDIFQDSYERMNYMLISSGFVPLDPRVPFDWMVLYCMCAEDSMFIDGKIQKFLSEIFPTTGAKPEFVYEDPNKRK